jgi:4-amino-4-deoxy-L-arabinose transferase-like glycosyltransferase
LARIIGWMVITCVLTVVFFTNIDRVTFHGDESLWINSSQYLELALSGDIHASKWRPSFETVTQPPIARYVIGLGRLAGGHGVDDLNRAWRFDLSADMNEADGRMPSPSLLWWSRLPMAITAVMSSLLLIYCAQTIAGRLAGHLLLLFIVTTPYYALHLRRAMGESLLLLGMMLVVLAGYRAIQSWQGVLRQCDRQSPRGEMTLARPLVWLLLLAVSSGMAGATKLNGLALVGAGMTLCAMLVWKSRTRLPGKQTAIFAVAGLVLMPVLTGAVFTAVNPYLYSDPLRRFEMMVDHRTQAIREQQAANPSAALPTRDVLARARVVPRSILRFASPVNHVVIWVLMGALTLVGLVVLARHAVMWWRDDGRSGMGMAVLLVAGVTGIPALLTPLNWDRYYMPAVVFASLCAAIALPRVFVWLRSHG